eukprot:COSAG02_NODE_1166_length_14154_cov_19.442191_6_plen_71_part_00
MERLGIRYTGPVAVSFTGTSTVTTPFVEAHTRDFAAGAQHATLANGHKALMPVGLMPDIETGSEPPTARA